MAWRSSEVRARSYLIVVRGSALGRGFLDIPQRHPGIQRGDLFQYRFGQAVPQVSAVPGLDRAGHRIRRTRTLPTTGRGIRGGPGLGPIHRKQARQAVRPGITMTRVGRVQLDPLGRHGAQAAFAAAGSEDKTLRIFTIEEGGSEHVNADDPDPARQLMADRFAKRLEQCPGRPPNVGLVTRPRRR
jgi:hypothetical protein